MRLVARLYNEQWNFVKYLEGWTEEEILAYLPKGFKGHILIFQDGKRIKQYDVK